MRVFICAPMLALAALSACNTATSAPAGGTDLPPPPSSAQPVAENTGGTATPAASLDGTWQSVDDPKYVVRIAGTAFTDVYDGKVDATAKIRYVRSCDDKRDATARDFFLLVRAEGEQCYNLLEATRDRLSYSYVARGNTLSFRRVR